MKNIFYTFIILITFSSSIYAHPYKLKDEYILTKINTKICNPITINSKSFDTRPIVYSIIAKDVEENYNLFYLNNKLLKNMPHLKISHSKTPRHSDLDIVGRIKKVEKKSYKLTELDNVDAVINYNLTCNNRIKETNMIESPSHILVNNDATDERNEYNVYTVIIEFIINNKVTNELHKSEIAVTAGKVNLSYELAQEKINNKFSQVIPQYIR